MLSARCLAFAPPVVAELVRRQGKRWFLLGVSGVVLAVRAGAPVIAGGGEGTRSDSDISLLIAACDAIDDDGLKMPKPHMCVFRLWTCVISEAVETLERPGASRAAASQR